MLVKEVMTADPAFARPDTPLRDIARMMAENCCGEIPVCDERGVIGVITDRDMACRGLTQGLNPLDIPVRYVMSTGVVSISENDTVDRAAQVMSDARVVRLPVISNGRLIGIVSRSDVISHLSDGKVAQLARCTAHARSAARF